MIFQFSFITLTMNSEKMMVQELNEEFLLNLLYRLDFEMELRTLAYSVDQSEGEDTWLQPMYLIPMWNMVEKLEAFKPYFNEFDVIFPTHMYRQPIDLSTAFPHDMILIKQEEFIFKSEKIKVEYRYI